MRMADFEVRPDLNNPAHEPHWDVTLPLPLPEIKGAEHMRIREDGTLLGGETCTKKHKGMAWSAD